LCAQCRRKLQKQLQSGNVLISTLLPS
jgi:hypothetical protein